MKKRNGMAWRIGCAWFLLALAGSAGWAQKSAPEYAWGGYDSNDKLDGMQGGWWFNLGPTGVRAKMETKEPKTLLVKYVFPGSPADKLIKVDDKIEGVNGNKFKVADHFIYRGGEGKHPLGARHYFGFDDGPRYDIGMAVEESEGSPKLKGKLTFMVVRGGKSMEVAVQLKPIGYFARNFPYDCKKSKLLVKEGCEFLMKNQGWRRSQSSGHACWLALLAQGETYMPFLKESFQAMANGGGGGGWSWMSGLNTIPHAEYYLATKDKTILPLLKRDEENICGMQGPNGAYMHKKWAPGGYSEMAFPAGLCGTAWALLKQCGVSIDTNKYMKTRLLLTASTRPDGGIGYGTLWTDYKPLTLEIDSIKVDPKGASSSGGLFDGGSRLAGGGVMATMMHYLDPMDKISEAYVKRGIRHAYNSRRACTSGHLTGYLTTEWVMITAGLGTVMDDMETYRAFMDHWKSWLNQARCYDGGWYFEPTSDNQLAAWHGPRWAITGGAIMLLSVPQHGLAILGRDRLIPGVDKSCLSPSGLAAYNMVKGGKYRSALQAILPLKKSAKGDLLASLEILEAAALKPILLEVGNLDALLESKDLFKLQEQVIASDRKYKGLAVYDEKTQPLRTALAAPENQKLIEIGKVFYTGVGLAPQTNVSVSAFYRPKKGQALQKTKEFLDVYRDTPYGPLARQHVKGLLDELNEILNDIVEYQKEGDVYQAVKTLTEADKEYGQFALYVEKTAPMRTALFVPENKEAMRLGETYYGLASYARKFPGAASLKKLASFAAAHPDTLYGKKAKSMAEEGDVTQE